MAAVVPSLLNNLCKVVSAICLEINLVPPTKHDGKVFSSCDCVFTFLCDIVQRCKLKLYVSLVKQKDTKYTCMRVLN